MLKSSLGVYTSCTSLAITKISGIPAIPPDLPGRLPISYLSFWLYDRGHKSLEKLLQTNFKKKKEEKKDLTIKEKPVIKTKQIYLYDTPEKRECPRSSKASLEGAQ